MRSDSYTPILIGYVCVQHMHVYIRGHAEEMYDRKKTFKHIL